FHSAELPPATADMVAEADRYIRQVSALLAAEPKPYRDHPYWIGTYEAYLARKAVLHGTPAVSTSAGAAPGQAPSPEARLLRGLYKKLFGYPPNVRIWHPDWLDFREVGILLRSHLGLADGNILYVKHHIGAFDHTIGAVAVTDVTTVLAGGCAGIAASGSK